MNGYYRFLENSNGQSITLMLVLSNMIWMEYIFGSRLSHTNSDVTQLVFQISDSSTLRPLPFSNSGFMMTLEPFELQILISVSHLLIKVAGVDSLALNYVPTKIL